jgi:hypothetical protein
MTSLPVLYTPAADMFSDAERVRGILTTDHAASSYGLPVFVRDDGTVLGPAELGATHDGLCPDHERVDVYTPEYGAVRRADMHADSRPYPGRKYRPEVCNLLAAARSAGYPAYHLEG